MVCRTERVQIDSRHPKTNIELCLVAQTDCGTIASIPKRILLGRLPPKETRNQSSASQKELLCIVGHPKTPGNSLWYAENNSDGSSVYQRHCGTIVGRTERVQIDSGHPKRNIELCLVARTDRGSIVGIPKRILVGRWPPEETREQSLASQKELLCIVGLHSHNVLMSHHDMTN